MFPEDANLNDWDSNREYADDLAAKLGLKLPLPNHLDFPQGTMFWVRPKAIKSMIDLGLRWTDYPAEPVPIDGTMLHALERLVPFVVAQEGFFYATVTE